MGKIVCLMGKSSSGKDTVYKKLLEQDAVSLQKIVPYTTRPIRAGEQDGVDAVLRIMDAWRRAAANSASLHASPAKQTFSSAAIWGRWAGVIGTIL